MEENFEIEKGYKIFPYPFSKENRLAFSNQETEEQFMNQQSSKLQAKDLITIGIFTAIYFVVFWLALC